MTITLHYPEFNNCEHTYPDDWEFGGADGRDPRADRRWRSTTYAYLDRTVRPICHTQAPLCDHAAVLLFKDSVERHWLNGKVFYISALRPNGSIEMIYSDIEGALGGGTR